jgi:hypothetical protein
MLSNERVSERQQMSEPNMDADQFCNWLLEQDPDLVLHWLSEVWEGSRQAPEGFNWLGLAEISPNLAIKQEDLGWARVAVLVNTSPISEAKAHGHVFFSVRGVPPEKRERVCFTCEERVMRLRVRFLLQRGYVPGDPVLDADRLVESFFDGLMLSPEEALKKYATGKEGLSREHIWKLERIRRNLEFLRPLAERHLLPANQELLTWYSLREQLHCS